MSYSTVESPLSLNSVDTRVGISSYSFMICFLANSNIGDWNFHREAFYCKAISHSSSSRYFKPLVQGLSRGNHQDIQRHTFL